MKFTRYTRYVGEPGDAIDLHELMQRLSDFFLQSGFETKFYGFQEMDPARTMEQLREAILKALLESDLMPQELAGELLKNPDLQDNEFLRKMIDQLIERLSEEGYISPQPAQVTPPPAVSALANLEDPQSGKNAGRFEITDKTLDFLGFKTLKDLLGSVGHSSIGRHDTRDLSTGVESGGSSRSY